MKTHRRAAATSAALILVAVGAGCATAAPASTPSGQTATTPTISAVDVAVTVSISGGHETDPVDNGRPVVLVAAGLGVPTEVFREAFSSVNPAGAGEEVDEERANANKAVLLSVLGPYGITNDQLDTVSNFYRYVASNGELWTHRDATAVAVVENGVVTGITITEPGTGYSSVPTVTLSTGQTVEVTLFYGTDLATNGSLASISLAR